MFEILCKTGNGHSMELMILETSAYVHSPAWSNAVSLEYPFLYFKKKFFDWMDFLLFFKDGKKVHLDPKVFLFNSIYSLKFIFNYYDF